MIDSTMLPLPTGHTTAAPTLCIGLDIAWYGGSKRDPSSQFDFVAASVIGKTASEPRVECRRVALTDRDQDGTRTIAALRQLIDEHRHEAERVVLSIDAPLQAAPVALAPLRMRAFRQCERHFSQCRKAIDAETGGANGWHPNIQPGLPLAERVSCVMAALRKDCQIVPWTLHHSQYNSLMLECFPAEAIWAAKRLGRYREATTAAEAKAYKKQARRQLSGHRVRELVEITLLDAFKTVSDDPYAWPRMVETILCWMLADTTWQAAGLYRGGKLLDDVVDSAICLATSVSYASNNAHVWQHPGHRDDGHIIGPGRF